MKPFQAYKIIFCSMLFINLSVNADIQMPDWDQNIIRGELANGFKYYAYHSKDKSEPFNLRLIVHAGSIDEPKVKGIAHAVEHMVFNQTKHHPDGLHQYIRDLGWQTGKQVNARTQPTETQYMIRTRPNDALNLDGSLQLLAEIASNATFTNAQWHKEQKIITEEKRIGESVIKRLSQQIKQSTKANSKYAQGSVIGSYQSINDITLKDLQLFYQRNYVASNMTLIASGYFNPKQLTVSITKAFNDLPKLPKPNRRYVEFPLDKQIKLNKVQDRQGSTSKVVLGLRMEIPNKSTIEGVRGRLENYVIRKLLSAQIRLGKTDLPESVPSIVAVLKEPTNERLVLAFSAQTKTHNEALKSILKEMERLRRYGFAAEALQEVLTQTRKTAKRNVNAAKKHNFSKWEDKITSAVLTNGVVSEATEKLNLTYKLLDEVTLERINKRLTEILNADDIFIYYQAPNKVKLTLPTVQQVNKWKQGIHSSKVLPSPKKAKMNATSAINKEVSKTALAAITLPVSRPKQDSISSPNIHYKKQSVYEWQLNNGNKVVWLDRPTTTGKIQLKAISNIGSSNNQHTEWLSNSALQVFEQSMPSNTTQKDWVQWQKENDAQWKFKLHPHHLDLSLTAKQEQLDSVFFAFWLNHQYRPFNKEALNAVKKSVQPLLKELSENSLSQLRYGNTQTKKELSKQLKTLTVETLNQTSHQLINQPHTLFIVGEMNKDKLQQLIGTYLSPLVNEKALTQKYILQKRGNRQYTQQHIGEEKTRITLYGSTPLTWTPETAFMLSTLNPIIQKALSKRLRLELAGVYRVAFEMKINPDTSYVESELSFISAPERADELALAAQKVLINLEPAINAVNLSRIKEDIQFAEQDRLATSSTWIRRLMLSYRKYNDPRYLEAMLTLPDKLTRAELIKLSKQVLPTQHQIRIDTEYSLHP